MNVQRYMESIASLVMAVCLVAAVSACGGDNGGGGTTSGQDTKTADGSGGDGSTPMPDASSETMADGSNNGQGQCQPIDPPPIEGAECSLLCQDCGENKACVIGQNQQGEQLQSCISAGPGEQGDPCSAQTPCKPGFTCAVEESGAQEGTCREYCRTGAQDNPCGEDGTCNPLQGFDEIGVCFVRQSECNSFPEDSCESENKACIPTREGKKCLEYNSDASVGDTCTAPANCNQKQTCTQLQGMQERQCFKLCDPDNSECADGKQCRGITAQEGEEPLYHICISMGA